MHIIPLQMIKFWFNIYTSHTPNVLKFIHSAEVLHECTTTQNGFLNSSQLVMNIAIYNKCCSWFNRGNTFSLYLSVLIVVGFWFRGSFFRFRSFWTFGWFVCSNAVQCSLDNQNNYWHLLDDSATDGGHTISTIIHEYTPS